MAPKMQGGAVRFILSLLLTTAVARLSRSNSSSFFTSSSPSDEDSPGERIGTTRSSHNRRLSYIPPLNGEYTDYSHHVLNYPYQSQRVNSQSILDSLNHWAKSFPDAYSKQSSLNASNFLSETRNITALSAAAAVWEEKVGGWDVAKHTFRDPAQSAASEAYINGKKPSQAKRKDWAPNEDRRLQDLFDITIVTGNPLASSPSSSAKNDKEILQKWEEEWIAWLEAWRFAIEPIHLIIIQQGDPSYFLPVPSWANYELYTKLEVAKALGYKSEGKHADSSWLVDMDSSSTTAMSFGILVSDKLYLYFLHRDSYPYTPPGSTTPVNPLEGHLVNLMTPSTPYYFNTLYDPFRLGNDFSRGYPSSLKEGIPTAISLGHSVKYANVDASTRLRKAVEEDNRMPDIAQTIPYGILFSLSTVNLAVHRPILSQGLYFFPTLPRQTTSTSAPAVREYQITDRYMEVLCGWFMKVTLDHIRAGVKLGGVTYVTSRDNVNPFDEIKGEALFAQDSEELLRFFSNVRLNPKSDHMSSAISDLTSQLEGTDIAKKNEAIASLIKAWKLWDNVFNTKTAFKPELLPVSSRSSIGPRPDSPHKCAVFTIMHDEPYMLPVWIRYYTRHFPNAVFVVEHMMNISSHAPPHVLDAYVANISHIAKGKNVSHSLLYGDSFGFPVHFFVAQAEIIQARLFRAGYQCVLYTDCDEIIAPNPIFFPTLPAPPSLPPSGYYNPGGLTSYLQSFMENPSVKQVRAVGYDVAHISESTPPLPSEPPLDWSKNVLAQRSYYLRHPKYDKPLLSKTYLRWKPGFHNTFPPPHIYHDMNLTLLHLTEIDKEFCLQREEKKYHIILTAHKWETGGGFNVHMTEYPQALKAGRVCKNARGKKLYQDKDGAVDALGGGLEKMDEAWKTVIV